MPQEPASAQVVRRYYAAFNAGDRPAMLALLAETVAHDVNQGPRETGKPAFAAFLARMDQCYREQLVEMVIMAAGDRVAAEFVVEGSYLHADDGLPPAHGQRYRLPAGAFFSLEAGLITRVTTYYNLADWLRQVGEA